MFVRCCVFPMLIISVRNAYIMSLLRCSLLFLFFSYSGTVPCKGMASSPPGKGMVLYKQRGSLLSLRCSYSLPMPSLLLFSLSNMLAMFVLIFVVCCCHVCLVCVPCISNVFLLFHCVLCFPRVPHSLCLCVSFVFMSRLCFCYLSSSALRMSFLYCLYACPACFFRCPRDCSFCCSCASYVFAQLVYCFSPFCNVSETCLLRFEYAFPFDLPIVVLRFSSA